MKHLVPALALMTSLVGCQCGEEEVGSECPPGATCEADAGSTAPMDGGQKSPDGSQQVIREDGGPPPDRTCASVSLDVTVEIPNVVLVVDQSTSMNSEFETASRWDTLRDALLDDSADGSFLYTRQGAVRFGLALFSVADRDVQCPDLTIEPPRLDNFAAIQSVWRDSEPLGGTPTGAAIDAILNELEDDLSSADPSVLILATDGNPDTCEDKDDEVNGKRLSVEAVERAYGLGIETYVISVDTGVETEHLQDLANAGVGRGEGDPSAPFAVVTDTSELEGALDDIVGGIGSCVVEMDGMIDTSRACDGTVELDGDPLTCNGEDGWEAVDESRIELKGAACTQLKSGGGELRASFPCGVVLI